MTKKEGGNYWHLPETNAGVVCLVRTFSGQEAGALVGSFLWELWLQTASLALAEHTGWLDPWRWGPVENNFF